MQIKFLKNQNTEENYTFDECLFFGKQGFPDKFILLNTQLWFLCFPNYKAADSKTPGCAFGRVYRNPNTGRELRKCSTESPASV